MEDKSEKEKLEHEFGFLKESFDAEIISKEEFEKGKERIEKKLKEIEMSEHKGKEEQKKETKIRLNVIQDEADGEQHLSHVEEPKPPKENNKNIEPVPEPVPEPSPDKAEEKGQKKVSKFFKYAVAFAVLIIAIFFLYYFFDGYSSAREKSSPLISKIPKISDAPKIEITVLNGRNDCFNCDTQRVLNILEGWFGEIKVTEADYSAGVGKELAEKFDLRLLPAYILDSSIEKKDSYDTLKQVFIKKNGKYILSQDAAGSSFYFKRESIPNKLDLFTIENESSSISSEKNLKEFLDNFKEAKFEKHSSKEMLTAELGIKTFPTFLLNNRIKFSGVFSAETIKENFCNVNKLERCKISLSRSLVN